MTTHTLPANAVAFLDAVAQHLEQHDRFDRVTKAGGRVIGHAEQTPDEAQFRVEVTPDEVFLTWASDDRYLSQSIEASLMWSGDDLDDMVDEEIVDAGWELGRLAPNKHHRDDEMCFVFRWKTPLAPDALDPAVHAPQFAAAMGGMVEAFAELGDMAPEEDD